MAWRDMYPPRPRTYVGERTSQTNPNFIADEQTGWRMRPGHGFSWRRGARTRYQGNSDGFRGPSNSATVAVPRLSIAVLGDSFMWGTGVAYGRTAGQYVATTVESTQVLNYAMPGFGVDQIYQSLIHQAIPSNPNIIVIGIFTDDFDRSFTAYRWVERFTKPIFTLNSEGLTPQGKDDRPGALFRWLESNSRLFAFARHVDRWAGLNYGMGSWWALNAALIDAMATACREADVPVLFIHIPYKRGTEFEGLRQHMKRNQYHYIDLNPLMSPSRRKDMYFKDDGHLNADGHTFVGQLIVDWADRSVPGFR